MSTSSLLAALIASSVATNGMITVGDTQPFDQVRLYQNPANNTVLTNQSTDGLVDASTTALVVTGSTAPTGLVFEPNLGVLRNVTSDIKFMVDSTVDLELSVEIAGTTTSFNIEAGKTAVLTIGLIAGVPLIVGSHNFFELAANGGGTVSGMTLINAVYNASTEMLVYNSGQIFGTSAMLVRLDMTDGHYLSLVIPDRTYSITVALSEEADYAQALNDPLAGATMVDSSLYMTNVDGVMLSANDRVLFRKIGNQLSLQINEAAAHLSPVDPSISGECYLYVLVTNNGFSTAPDISMLFGLYTSEEQ